MTISYPAMVRRATPDDIDALLLLVPPIIAETTLLPVSMTKVEALIEKCALQLSGSIAGVIDGVDGIDAAVGLSFVESETSDIPFLKAVWCGLSSNVRKHPGTESDPRAHFGRALFDFSRWCHHGLEQVAGHPILMTFDISTKTMLGAKMRLYQRNLVQTGASFSLGASGSFKPQDIEVDLKENATV